MVRVFLLQSVKQQIYGVLEGLVILPHLHSVQHLYQRGKVLFIGGSLIVDVADQGRIKQRLCLDPEIVPGFALTLGVGDKSGDDFQNVFLRMNVGEGVEVHTFLEVDRIEHLDLIRLVDDLPILAPHRLSVLVPLGNAPLQELPALD